MKRFALLAIVAILATAGWITTNAGAQSATELRIATVAPEGSPWMQVFRRWDRDLREETGGQVGLTFYPGGSQGQESEFIDKMGAGQLDGAAVTSGGLGQIVRPVLVLSAPGILTEYAELDRARRRLARRFERQFERNGYKLLGWGDVGKARLMSTERIESPSELRSRRPWAPRNDEIFAEFLSVVGSNPRRLGIPEVYPALNTRMIDTVPASAIAAVSLQWYTKLRFYSEQNSGVLIGATILKKERFDALSEAHQTSLMDTSRRAHRLLARAIRREDTRSLRVLGRRMTAVDTSPHEAEWAQAAETARNNLAGRVYPQALLDAVIRAAGD
ncbi:MAG: TRAP transporter substrate-binding protein DctP [Myxococcota bacterium]